MATKTKLETAIERQAGNLDEAQQRLVMSQFSTYDWNRRRIQQIEGIIELGEGGGKPIDAKTRKALMTERHQLTVDNVSISTKLFMQLKGTGGSEDEFDAFLKGGK